MVRTRGRQDGGRRLAALLALSLSLAAGASPAPARAEDAPRAADASGEPVRLDFDGFRAPPAPRAANGLWVPTDEGYAGAWTEPFGTPSGEEGAPAVQAFQEPWTPLHALAPEVVEDLLRRLVPEGAGGGWASRATTEGIEVWTTPSNRPRVARALDFVREAFAPRLVVLADLVGTDKGEQVTLASGAVGLLPRRWTTIVHRRDTKLHVVGYAAEVAQEAVVARPLVASIPSGEEIYARWTPGETVSVLEVFAGDLDARDPVEIDLSTLRLTPEAAGPGRVVLPRTAVRRARTAILLPAGKATEAEIVWSSADGTRRLRLRVDTATAAPQDLPLGEDRVGVVRAGAATAALEGAPREGGPEASVRAFQSSGATDVTLEPLAQAFVLATGGAEVVERLRAAVRRGEATLSGATVEIVAVELLAASSAWAREAVVGKALPAAASPAVEQAPVLWSVRVPVLGGVPAAVRTGSSVVGFGDIDATVAQSAGGLSPMPGAWFDGAALDTTVTFPAGGGARLRLSGTWSWADARATSAEIVFRLPIPLSPVTMPPMGGEEMPVRRATIPLAGHGSQSLDTDLLLSAEDLAKGSAVVVAHVRSWPSGGRTFPALVLARVRR